MKKNKKKKNFSECYWGTLVASLLGKILTGKGKIWAGKGTIRRGENF